MKQIPAKLWWAVVLSAVLQLLPFPLAGPVPSWRRYFCWICMVPLLWALRGKSCNGNLLSVRQGFTLGYACGTLWYLGNCYWIFQTMHLYGGIPSPGSAVILLLFSLYLGLYLGLFGAVACYLRQRLGALVMLAITPFLWVAVEMARDRITGFPWDLLGGTLVDANLALLLAPVTGVMGLSLVIAAANAAFTWAIVRDPDFFRSWDGLRKRTSIWALLGLCFACYVLATHKISPDLAVNGHALLLQENLEVGEEAKGPTETKEAMLADFSRRSLARLDQHPTIVLWPESPAPFEDADPEFRQAMSALARTASLPVIADNLGVDRDAGDARGYQLYNSADVFRADGSFAGRYDKTHLVPFGEYVPYKNLFFFAGSLLREVGQFTPGQRRQVFNLSGHRYGVFICYESIFGDEVRQFVQNGAEVLVNLSNDGWYGDTSAPWQHLDMVRMRAIENRRWILRATNTGVTGAISPDGVLTTQAPRHERLALLAGFSFEDGLTFYTRHGDWLGWLCVALTFAAVGFGRLRRRTVH